MAFPFGIFCNPQNIWCGQLGSNRFQSNRFILSLCWKFMRLSIFFIYLHFFFSRSRRLLARQRHRSSGDGGRYLCEFFFAVENAGVDLVLFLVMLLFFRSKFGTDKPLKKCMSMRREKNRIKNVVTALRIVESMKKRKLFTGQSKRRKKERKRANDNYNV